MSQNGGFEKIGVCLCLCVWGGGSITAKKGRRGHWCISMFTAIFIIITDYCDGQKKWVFSKKKTQINESSDFSWRGEGVMSRNLVFF